MAKGRNLGWVWVLVAIVVLVAGGLTWSKTARGFSARAKPTWIESWLAGVARNWALPAGEKQLRNPLPPSAENLAAGRQHFAAHCAICHNNNGDGLTDMGKNFYPKPPDLRGLTTQDKSDGALFYSIRNGIRMSAMPAWPDDPDTDIWQLVQLIRHLPKQSPEELREMQRYNPHSIYPEPLM